MIALLTVVEDGWHATVIAGEDDDDRDAPSDEWLIEHTRVAISIQATRGGGVFVAPIPIEATTP